MSAQPIRVSDYERNSCILAAQAKRIPNYDRCLWPVCASVGNDLKIFPTNSEKLIFNLEYEQRRRRKQIGIFEDWVIHKVFNASEAQEKNQFIMEMAKIIFERKNDGFDYQRKAAASKLANLIHNKIHEIQNPENCSEARLFFCFGNRGGCGGFGAQVHALLKCLVFAFGSGRTMIPNANFDWILTRYKPLSYRCASLEKRFAGASCNHLGEVLEKMPYYSTVPIQSPVQAVWAAYSACLKRAKLNISGQRFDFRSILPEWNLPTDIAEDLKLVSSEPAAWYLGQFIGYILRPAGSFVQTADAIMAANPWTAMQARGTEVWNRNGGGRELFNVSKYMKYIEAHFDILDAVEKLGMNLNSSAGSSNHVSPPNKSRKIFVATDEPCVLRDLARLYPTYNIDFNESYVAAAKARGDNFSITDILVISINHDIFKLAASDFVICAFTSNVCLLAYKLRMVMNKVAPDSWSFISLAGLWSDKLKNGKAPLWYTAVEASNGDFGQVKHNIGDTLEVRKGAFHGSSKWGLAAAYNNNNKSDKRRVVKLSRLERIYHVSDAFPAFTTT